MSASLPYQQRLLRSEYTCRVCGCLKCLFHLEIWIHPRSLNICSTLLPLEHSSFLPSPFFPLSLRSFLIMKDAKSLTSFVRVARKIYNPIGFQKGYNFVLCENISASPPDSALIITLSGFVFAGALFGFILARLQYLSIDGKFREGSSPGEWYWLRNGHMRVGITLHLSTIIPAGFLVVFQVRCRSVRHLCLAMLDDAWSSSFHSSATKP